MILKFRINGAWKLIDRIDEIDILPAGENGRTNEGAIGSVNYLRGGSWMGQDFGGEAYLLNDEGKTVQRLTHAISAQAEVLPLPANLPK